MLPENLDAFAAGRGEVTHVLNDPQNRYVDLFKHGDAFSHHAERSFLGRRDDYPAVERHSLAKGELRVTGTWRQVHQQVIELPPIHGAEKLLNGLHNHWTAPDHRRVALEQKTHAHQLHPII